MFYSLGVFVELFGEISKSKTVLWLYDMYIFATSSNINQNDNLENQHCVFMRLYWAIFLGATFVSRRQIMTPRVVWDRTPTVDQVLCAPLRLFLLHRIWWWRWFLGGLSSRSDARNRWASLGWRTPVFPGGIWKDSDAWTQRHLIKVWLEDVNDVLLFQLLLSNFTTSQRSFCQGDLPNAIVVIEWQW